MPAMAGTILATDRTEKRKGREGEGRGGDGGGDAGLDGMGKERAHMVASTARCRLCHGWKGGGDWGRRRKGMTSGTEPSATARERHSGLFSTAEMGCGPGKEGVRARVGGDGLARLGP